MENKLLTRREDGRLVLQSLDLEILIGDLFALCKNERETEWLEENLAGVVEVEAERRRDELELE